MEILDTYLSELKIIEPVIHGDRRGWFMETFNYSEFKIEGITLNIVQNNHSFSAAKGTLRGLHYQLNPKAQSKLVRCIRGEIYDVAVDIRRKSPTFGEWFGINLSAENKKQLLIPSGFAHGFVTLTENTEVQYSVDNDYSLECERSILWNDPIINIKWPGTTKPILSEKDAKAPLLENAEINFFYKE